MQSSFIRRTLPQTIFVIAAVLVGVFLSHKDSVFNVSAIGSFGGPNALSAELCNRFPTGVSTSTTTTSLTDTTSGGVAAGWVTDEWAGHNVNIFTTAGLQQFQQIVSNTATTLNIDVPGGDPEVWSPALPGGGGSFYEIVVDPTDPNCSDGAGAIATDSPLNLTTQLEIGLSDYNFSAVVTTTPGTGFLAAGPGSAAFTSGAGCEGGLMANCPQLGDIVGQLVSDTSLGLTNNACSSNLTVDFKFMVATVDNSLGNLLWSLAISQASDDGILENHLSDDGSAKGPDDVAGGADAVAGTTPLNGLPAAVERYPQYLNAVFDPDFINYGADGIPAGKPATNGAPADGDGENNGSAPPVQPIQRLRGGAIVSNSAVELDLMIFAPGALASAFAPPHPFADLAPEMGYTTVTVLQNPTTPAAPSAITDFCANLRTLTTVHGEARNNQCNGVTAAPCNTRGVINTPATGIINGRDRARTPSAAGSYGYNGYAASLRDTDGDGYENPLDTCPVDVNTQNPRLVAGADGDMIDPACDPTPASDSNSGNHDTDVATNLKDWQNAGDNCPLLVNGDQLESELNHSYYETFATNPAPHGGPKTDAIGDTCDSDDVQANGDFLSVLNMTGKCIGGTDADSDGWCSAAGAGLATFDPNDNAGAGVAEGVCTGAVDNDSDGIVNDGCPIAGTGTGGPFSEAGVPGGCANDIDELDEDPGPAIVGDDTVVNDGCPTDTGGVAMTPEDYDMQFTFGISHSGAGDNPPERLPVQVCNDGIDNDGDLAIDFVDQAAGNSTCRPVNIEAHQSEVLCADLLDQDGDLVVNDGCGVAGTGGAETGAQCYAGGVGGAGNTTDDDGDTFINDGCPANSETVAQCADALDNDNDGLVNEGCAASGPAETGAQCWNAIDDDGDGGIVNDGCPGPGAAEPGANTHHCGDALDNDADGGFINDGCAAVSAELPAQCGNMLDEDGDGFPNDGCPAVTAVGVNPADSDRDGFTDEAERFIGTDALGTCQAGAFGVAPTGNASTGWPTDLASSIPPPAAGTGTDRETVTDVLAFTTPVYRINTRPGDPGYSPRFDLLFGPSGAAANANWIVVGDVLTMTASTPSGFPPMRQGVRAFNNYACTNHGIFGN